MKKYLLTIILFILIIPNVVMAGTCNPSDIEIKSVTLSKTLGTGEEVTTADVDDKSINIDVKLNNPNDYMEYTIKVKNNGTEDYYIKEADFNNDQYLKYEFVHENNSFKVEPGEEKEITLRVSYVDRVEGNANYTATDTLALNIIDNQTVQVANTLKNVGIVAVIIVNVTLISIFIGGGILINNKTKNILLILIGIAILIPMYANASCDATIDVDVRVELDNKNAMFDTGRVINKKIKTLAGHTYVDSRQPWSNDNKDANITSFVRSTTEPSTSNKEAKNIVSAQDSDLPIYMWYDSGTLYWWSEDETPSLNPQSDCFLTNLIKLEDINTVQYFDASTATDLGAFFENLNTITDISAVANWNVSNNTSLYYVFSGLKKVTDISVLANWDTSNVINASGVFCSSNHLTDLTPIANWDTRNVTDMSWIFCGLDEITDISPIANWNTSKVETFNGTFECVEVLEDFTPISNWDFSKVKDVSWSFECCYAMANIDFMAGWDVSKVEIFDGMFCDCSSLTSVNALANWDISSATSFCCFFDTCTNLADVSGVLNWDVSKVENFSCFFCDIDVISELDLTTWDISSATDISWMFNGMDSLVTLDISSFDTRNVTNFEKLFMKSSNLTTVYIGENWNISANTGNVSEVFPTSCHLPNFSTSNTNYRYLSWAKPTTQGGYLTLKTNS